MKAINLLLFLFLFHLQLRANQPNDSVTTVSIKAIAGMQFDVVRFNVKPGAKVKLIFSNADDMSHNLLITKPGARMEVVDAALKLGEKGIALSYIPQLPSVLWSIPVISPGESMTITFTVPEKPGIYPFVCTYPGHGFIMYGAMYVTEEAMPPLKDDQNIPPNRRMEMDKGSTAGHSAHLMQSHPYKDVPPYLYRTFIQDSGPAAIAVRLPQRLSYFWDAGECRLRYATSGEFLDMKELWAGHRQAVARNLGQIFYRDKTEYPLRTGSPGNIPEVQFKGYKLINRYPEFHYLINGIDVYELIKEKTDGSGLLRTFRIPKANQSVWFVFSPDDGIDYAFSGGKLSDGKLELSPAGARQFTISMTKNGGAL
ncbi:plastocyanin/azurin family copper-binding protein [Daejeonella sp. H1SJ63]|uniref:plastocyanin/azurin family copper-binding protein n=1 Tax=Daejeonella sp. H1SJ63 TaxID=3034145 RepID=UPI0023EDD587|nr:plastocyanin/azurin family copper-binding protein [Daejeonella sp. H1SJ63]